ncbi:hypothetical protein [Pseudonocardia acidicola]|uniref:Uncharacterized protein n=1 Tax=Pseudonocardia acidicola TaxID=2724939 RepID=A0ABX1S5T1_9PSEU|nr:hypothetical protein [Pseudonocardia acidicola]NMH96938.1 hypothetical protein [Pseudonocardia acidicola]
MPPRSTASRIVFVLLVPLGVVGLATLSPAVVMLGLLTATLTGLGAFGWAQQRHGWPDGASRSTRTFAWRAAGMGLLVVLGLSGLVGLFGAAAVPVLVLAAASGMTVGVGRRLGRGRRRGEVPGEAADHTPPGPEPPVTQFPAAPVRDDECPQWLVPALSTEMLCWEWRRSYVAVGRTRDPKELVQLVVLRAAYLDELERRDPRGFRRWLDSGARAAGDPARFLTGG